MLYPFGQNYVLREQVVGLVVGYMPYVGWITLAARTFSGFKQLLA